MSKNPPSARLFLQFGLSVAVAAMAMSVANAQDRGGSFMTAGGGNGSDPIIVHYGDSDSNSTNSSNNHNNNSSNNSYGSSSNSFDRQGFGGMPDAVQRLTQGHHGAMPNPATMPLDSGDPVSARQAEHQNIINQMRKHGASEGRINSYREQTEDAPGTTYHMVGGLKMRDDGMTPGQALNNITHSGLMNTLAPHMAHRVRAIC